jgi:hypothetical protein
MSNPYLKAANMASKVKTYDRKTGQEFDPQDVGPKNSEGKRYASANKMFNSQGELNASDKRDAFNKVEALMDGLGDGTYDITRKAANEPTLSDEEAQAILREAFSDPTSEGFNLVGQGLLNPIKEVIDFEGIARKLWAPRTVKAGEVVRYDKDPFVRAWVIAEDAQTPQSVVEGRYIYPPEFEVTSYPTLEIKDQYRAQFDILSRIQDRARQAIEYQEDRAAMNLLQAGGAAVNTTTFFGSLNIAALESLRYQIERHRLVADKFIINRQEVSDLINVVAPAADPVTQRELLMSGYIGTFLNTSIFTTAGTNTYQILDPGSVVAVTSPEYLGGMPIRIELMSEPVNEFMRGIPRKGWFFYELISMALINPAGVALGSKL